MKYIEAYRVALEVIVKVRNMGRFHYPYPLNLLK